MLPPVRHDLIEEDSMPVEIIDRLKKQRDDLLAALEVMLRDMKAVDSAGQYGLELMPAINQAEAAIASAKGGAA